MKKFRVLLLAMLCLLLLAGCGSQKQDPPAEGVVRVCSSMNRNLSEALVEDFANKTGIVVEFDPLVATSLSQRLDLLGASKVDVWLGGSAEEYYMAAERDMLVPYLPRGAANIPPQYMDRDGRWVGPPYGLITSLWQLRGRDVALQFAGSLRTQQVLYLPTEAKAGYEVYLGNKAVAVMSLRHALALEREHPFLYAVPVRDGNKNMITAVAILKNGEKRKEAERLMEYLLSKEALQIMRDYRMNPLADALNDKTLDGRGKAGADPGMDQCKVTGRISCMVTGI